MPDESAKPSLRFMLRHPAKFIIWYFEGMLFRIKEAE